MFEFAVSQSDFSDQYIERNYVVDCKDALGSYKFVIVRLFDEAILDYYEVDADGQFVIEDLDIIHELLTRSDVEAAFQLFEELSQR